MTSSNIAWKYDGHTGDVFDKSDQSTVCHARNPEDGRLIAAAPNLRAVLEALLKHYVKLVNSGDAGNWDPEHEPVVIEARRALEAK